MRRFPAITIQAKPVETVIGMNVACEDRHEGTKVWGFM